MAHGAAEIAHKIVSDETFEASVYPMRLAQRLLRNRGSWQALKRHKGILTMSQWCRWGETYAETPLPASD